MFSVFIMHYTLLKLSVDAYETKLAGKNAMTTARRLECNLTSIASDTAFVFQNDFKPADGYTPPAPPPRAMLPPSIEGLMKPKEEEEPVCDLEWGEDLMGDGLLMMKTLEEGDRSDSIACRADQGSPNKQTKRIRDLCTVGRNLDPNF